MSGTAAIGLSTDSRRTRRVVEPGGGAVRLKSMKPVAVNTPVLYDVAGQQTKAASVVAQRAVAERFDAAVLAPTFGLIGAPFLAALSAAMGTRATRLDGLAAAHAGQAGATAAGAAGYDVTDAANAGALGASGSGATGSAATGSAATGTGTVSA